MGGEDIQGHGERYHTVETEGQPEPGAVRASHICQYRQSGHRGQDRDGSVGARAQKLAEVTWVGGGGDSVLKETEVWGVLPSDL